ncbi:hypothetical protein AC249_AIPGENE15534 [Exaiptasia diaphana]|nr:hypothetical protein AC249_AIPGENE15534 [Exaiptasia diaphana]
MSALEKKMFYLSPRRKWSVKDKEWFTANPVGHNPLGNTVGRLCQKAGIEGHFTNHSLQATSATRGLEAGVPEKLIMEVTGHRDPRSLQRYQRPSVEVKKAISKCFKSGSLSFAEQIKKRNSAEESREETKKRVQSQRCTMNFFAFKISSINL